MKGPYWLTAHSTEFPAVEQALREPDGLLAVGGDLSPARLLNAYRRGIFPWYSAGQPILWWSPDPRTVLFPECLKVSRSLAKVLRQGRYDVTWDHAFEQVIAACAAPRGGHNGTWLTPAMIDAYCALHRLGMAHSVETWHQGTLAGGIYGVALGRVFFGESMFSRRADASKVALARLARGFNDRRYNLIDCQVYSEHLARLGAQTVPRREFINLLDRWCGMPETPA